MNVVNEKFLLFVTSLAIKNCALSSEIKKLGSDTIVYGLGTILPRMLNFLLVSLQTRVFPNQEDYGTISEFYGYAAFLNIIFLFGMETAFFRFVNKTGTDENRIFRITQTVVILICILSGLAIYWFIDFSSAVSLSQNKNLMIWLVLTLLIDAVVAIPFAKLRQQKKAKQFTFYKICNVLLLISLNLYLLLLTPSPSIEVVFIANFLANAVYLIFFFKDLISWRPLFDKQLTPEIFKYSYPLVITGLAGTTNEMFSRIALDNWLPENFYPNQTPKQAQGIFAACYKFSVFMSIAVQAFRFAAEPFFFSKASDKNSPKLFSKVNHYFVLFASVIMVGICLNMEWAKYFIDSHYWSGLSIVPILLIGYIFLGIYFNMSIWFKLTDKTYYGTIITLIGAILTIGFNYLLIPMYGIIGSSIATLLVYFFMTTICYWIGQRYYPIPYSIIKDMTILASASLLIFLNSQLEISNVWISVLARGLVSILIVTSVFYAVKKNFRNS